MLMQDSLTGYLHEVPDFAEAEPYGEVAYDGFGNPVGYYGERRRRRRSRATEPAPQPMPPPMPPEAGIGPEMGPEGGEGMPGGEEMGEVAYDGFGNPVGFFNPFRAIQHRHDLHCWGESDDPNADVLVSGRRRRVFARGQKHVARRTVAASDVPLRRANIYRQTAEFSCRDRASLANHFRKEH